MPHSYSRLFDSSFRAAAAEAELARATISLSQEMGNGVTGEFVPINFEPNVSKFGTRSSLAGSISQSTVCV